jgi:pyruvate ferredoxin oxidoreductase delta subunit
MSQLHIVAFNPPRKLADYPQGPTFVAGHLTEGNAGMRTFRPEIDNKKCVKCLRCFMLCPDGAIDKSGSVLEIDYNFCKGCGICASECKLKAISMKKEGEA